MKWRCPAWFFVLLAALPARAEPEIKLPLVPAESVERLVMVPAPSATCVAVGDAHGWLAVGHGKKHRDAHVSLFRLDNEGKLAADEPISITLAAPGKLAEFPNYPLSLAFHPKLPLLYVWQDIAVAKKSSPDRDDPARAEFDHLHIYSVAGPQPVLLQSQARGNDFAEGLGSGAIAVDATNGRLYLPNVHQLGFKSKSMYGTCGYLELDAEGLPVAPDPAAKREAPPRIGAKIELHFMAPSKPGVNLGMPQGLGFVPVSKDVVIVGVYSGAMTWDGSDRRGWSNVLPLHPQYRTGYHDRIAGHPTLPMIYCSLMGHNWLCSMQHAEGYLTLMPRRISIEGASFKSYPVVLKGRGELAVGGINRVYFVALDEKGAFKTDGKQVKINNRSADAVVYSDKFDCVYVAEERSK